ncbi:hypothetical protein GC163_01645 [bacterium]|nr:hypothetical protein [bacterium]
MFLRWSCLLLALGFVVVGSQENSFARGRVTFLTIEFVDYCDGLELQFRDRLGVIGRHTGCGFNEVVQGNDFTTADGEEGVTVQYFDRTLGRSVQIDVFQTGFRAGNFYVYELRRGELLRYGNWEEVP